MAVSVVNHADGDPCGHWLVRHTTLFSVRQSDRVRATQDQQSLMAVRRQGVLEAPGLKQARGATVSRENDKQELKFTN